MNYVKRRGCSTAKVAVENFIQIKAQFLFDIQSLVEIEEIPSSLIINWDQTAIKYVPVSTWTMADEGSKRVEIVEADDKRKITSVFSITPLGDFLHELYQGTTTKCLPNVCFPHGFDVTCTENHWLNECTVERYLDKILLPYITATRAKCKMDATQPALVLFDTFHGQCTERFQKLEENSVRVVIIAANCTDRLQPLDLSVNKATKDFLRTQFSNWYADQICSQL